MEKKQELQLALTAAMKARDEDTKSTLRLVLTSIKLAEVERRRRNQRRSNLEHSSKGSQNT